MGTVSFTVPDPSPPAVHRALAAACLAGGYDTTPVPTRRAAAGDRLSLTRDGTDSGCAMVAWPAPGLPPDAVTATSTLRPRAEPYSLPVELARGRVNRLRCQAAEWGQEGLDFDPADVAELTAITRRFGGLVLDPHAPAAAATADEVLARAWRLAGRLAATFAERVLGNRLAAAGRLPTRLGVRLAALPPPAEAARLAATVSAVRLAPDWAAVEPSESAYRWAGPDAVVEWATANRLHLSVGPVVDLAGGRHPGWLNAWGGDLPSLAAFTCDFVETVVRRYHGKVQAWVPVGGFNQHDAFGLGEDDRLRLAARLLEAVARTAPETDLVLGIGQPWGDYLADDGYTYSPLVFADTMARAGFRFAALDLELVGGPPPVGSRPRDALEVCRLFDLFGVLGIPLQLTAGRADWAELAAGVAAALPQVHQVTWIADDTAAGPTGPDGLFGRLRAQSLA